MVMKTKPKILIVEDDPTIQMLYRLKLELEGFMVEVADNGKTGLRAAKACQPDLILLDLKMPIMDGQEMLTRMRAEVWGSGIRVIILTNLSKTEAPSELRFFNVDRYVVKAHHTPKQLADIVREVLG